MEKVEFWDEYAAKRRCPTHKVVDSFVKDKIDFIKKHVRNLENKSILDVGCGNGRFLYHFPCVQKRGIDYSPDMIEVAKKNVEKGIVSVADGYNLPFADESFDIIFGGCYLHNLSNPDRALNEMKRVSRKYVILIEPNPLNPLMAIFNIISGEEEIKSVFKFTKRFYQYLFKKAGLKVQCFNRGTFTPNRTPVFLLTILEKLSFLNLVGFYYIIIGEK